jgi:hypothetical protein
MHTEEMVLHRSGLHVPAHLAERADKGMQVWMNPEYADLARQAEKIKAQMSGNYWVESLIVAQGDGTSFSNSAAANSVIPASAKITFAPSYFWFIGKQIRVMAMFRVSNIVTTPGTLTFTLLLGGTAIWNGGAQQLSTTAHTTLPVWLEALLTLRLLGTAGNFMGQGRVTGQPISFTNNADLATSNSIGQSLLPNTAPAVGGNVDLTTALQLDLQAQFSTANAGNLIQLHQYSVEAMN